MGKPKKPLGINLAWELVYEPPWEQEARLTALNSFSHGFDAGAGETPCRTPVGTKQFAQEKTALSGCSLMGSDWLRR